MKTPHLAFAMLATLGGVVPTPAVAQAQPPYKVSRDVEYGKAGERSLRLDIYEPRKRSSDILPVVVWIHGGGWRHGNKSSGAGVLAPFVSTGNYVGISVEYRLSGEAIWPAQIHDCKAAIRWIRANAKKLRVDPDRIGVGGHSAGGHLVSLLGTSGDTADLEGNNGSPNVSSKVRCVVDLSGPSDLTVFRHVRVDQLFNKPFDERKELAKAASPVTYISKDDPPFLIIHGTKDSIVPISQAELLHDRLEKAGVESNFVKIEGGGHSINEPEVLKRVMAFFEKHLRNKPVEVSSDPIKSSAK
ncbi:MAG: hypothetical protein KatS3mg105_3811 [Gemmatales bacterium]|nr:MAG: hypothetical protein KatS3mg105_3811 [Gemmatales bacterium]